MDGQKADNIRSCSPRKILLRSLLTIISILILSVIALKIYLSTPLAAAQLSSLLTSRLHQPVRVAGLHTAGCTLYLDGLSIDNPPGFPAGNLAKADSIALAPEWLEILFGRRDFRLVELNGVRLDLMENREGSWNFSPLRRALAAGKPSAPMFIGQLAVRGGALQVNGRGIQGIELKIFNLATSGSDESRIALAFEDGGRNLYRIEGKAHSGKAPAFDLALLAPALSLDRLAGALKLKNIPVFEGGKGDLRLDARLREGLLRINGGLDFSRLCVPLAGKNSIFAGKLSMAAGYDLQRDEARLETIDLSIDNLVNMRASGKVEGLGKERKFDFELNIDKLDLGPLAMFLPESERRRMIPEGTLEGRSIRFSGSGADGLTGMSGTLLLHNGSLTRGGRLLAAGLEGSLALAKADRGFLAKGRLSKRRTDDKALLERVEAQVEATLSPGMKPLTIQVPSFSLKTMGVRMTGRFGFRAAEAEPFALSLKIPATASAVANPLLEKLKIGFRGGTTSLALEAAGRGPQDFTATATARLADWKVSRGSQGYGVKQGTVDSRLGMRNGKFAASGKANLKGLALGGQTGDVRCSYLLADGKVVLSDAAFRNGGTSVTAARLTARLPVRESGQGTVRYPVSMEVAGAEIRHGEAAVKDLSGILTGSYASESGNSWLEGKAELAASWISWQGRVLEAPAARLAFSRAGARGELTGRILEGKVSAKGAFDPFALQKGGSFQLEIRGASLAKVADFLPGKGATISDGLLDASLSGGYSGRKGLDCRFSAKGTGLTINGSTGKNLLSNAGIGLSGAVSGKDLLLDDALLSAGDRVKLKAKGKMADYLSPGRKGSFSFTLLETDVNSLMDTVANALPRSLQEATFGGAVAAEARFDLQGERKILNGSVFLKRVDMELLASKFTAADIRGTFPFSLDFSGKGGAVPGEGLSFSRKNYSRLLERFRAQEAGPALFVGKLRLGPLELGPLTMQVRAGSGVTEITALHTSLYQGELFGRGYIRTGKELHYRGDLLLSNLSLLRFCNAFPGTKGYVSGRLDGIASLSGEGSRETNLGFSEFWTRSGSGEQMYVSREFLQKLAGRKLYGFFFRNNRPYDRAEIKALLHGGELTFEILDILHTNLAGIHDLNVSVVPTSNRISVERLLNAVSQAGAGGKTASGDKGAGEAPVKTQFKWLE